ncbi:hypothetical protein ACFOVU_10195 [Nocardiopsis sediminis]|uniref:DUF2178 domain-containing protein n=1 Tax=Nocardiopsis sediminis TaxID=1778267 RepID=A0ABV8FNM7_9ACTN
MRPVWILVTVAAVVFLGMRELVGEGDLWLTLGIGLLAGVLLLPVYLWVVWRVERREATAPARERAVSTTGTGWGTMLGIGMFVLVIANIVLLGCYEADGLGPLAGAVALLGFMAAAASPRSQT